MTRVGALVTLLACVAMVASGRLHAQARASASRDAHSSQRKADKREVVLDDVSRARKIAEMEAWLRRLVGRFRIDGTNITAGMGSKVVGSVDCVNVGDGPGVHCIINATWNHLSLPAYSGFDTETYGGMRPLVILYGIDPDAVAIYSTWVDNHVEIRSGVLRGDTATFPVDSWKGCDPFVSHCWLGSVVTAKSGSDITMRFGGPGIGNFEFKLKRDR